MTSVYDWQTPIRPQRPFERTFRSANKIYAVRFYYYCSQYSSIELKNNNSSGNRFRKKLFKERELFRIIFVISYKCHFLFYLLLLSLTAHSPTPCPLHSRHAVHGGNTAQHYILFICRDHTHLNYEITTGIFAISWSIYDMTHMRQRKDVAKAPARRKDCSGVVGLFGQYLFMGPRQGALRWYLSVSDNG